MAIKTVVTLQIDRSPADDATITQRAEELRASGLLIGYPVLSGVRTYTRIWATVEAANDWLVFMDTFTPVPASAEVVID
jgi:hypothetical protein